MASLALILSSISTVKAITKQIATNVLIGVIISTKSGTVENNRNSLIVEHSNVAILSFLD